VTIKEKAKKYREIGIQQRENKCEEKRTLRI
jgi:hypothetical protein